MILIIHAREGYRSIPVEPSFYPDDGHPSTVSSPRSPPRSPPPPLRVSPRLASRAPRASPPTGAACARMAVRIAPAGSRLRSWYPPLCRFVSPPRRSRRARQPRRRTSRLVPVFSQFSDVPHQERRRFPSRASPAVPAIAPRRDVPVQTERRFEARPKVRCRVLRAKKRQRRSEFPVDAHAQRARRRAQHAATAPPPSSAHASRMNSTVGMMFFSRLKLKVAGMRVTRLMAPSLPSSRTRYQTWADVFARQYSTQGTARRDVASRRPRDRSLAQESVLGRQIILHAEREHHGRARDEFRRRLLPQSARLGEPSQLPRQILRGEQQRARIPRQNLAVSSSLSTPASRATRDVWWRPRPWTGTPGLFEPSPRLPRWNPHPPWRVRTSTWSPSST